MLARGARLDNTAVLITITPGKVTVLSNLRKEKNIMKKENEVPFFARYLEGQEFPEVKTNIKAGATTKYPSDLDEMEHTLKYPSDGDET